ncbi:MAG TPA: hypothetical protein PKX92_04870 [Edaphocola sp.]|nr:hypothetical protein [Edaphocola sp.]
MNRIKITLVAVVIAITGFFLACQKEKPKYSCDSKVEQFVTTNIESFKNISRDDLGRYTPDTMQGIYNSLTPENKLNI